MRCRQVSVDKHKRLCAAILGETEPKPGLKSRKRSTVPANNPPDKPGQTQNLACVLRYWVKQGSGQA